MAVNFPAPGLKIQSGGAASGIDRALTRTPARAGARVYAADIYIGPAQATESGSGKAGDPHDLPLPARRRASMLISAASCGLSLRIAAETP